MTRKEADFIGGMNMCDEISNEAYRKIMCHCEEQELCEDCISRQAVCNIVDAIRDCISVEGYWAILERMKKLPSVNPQKIGYWEQYGNYWEDKFKCSECGKEQPKILCGERIIGHWSDYCPHCGAKMSEIPTGSERSE